MKNDFRKPVYWLLLIGAIGALIGCDKPADTPPLAAAPDVRVQTIAPTPVTITTELQGRTVAAEIAEIRPQVSGVVQSKLFAEGTKVKAGQPLFQLETETYRSAVAQAQANLKVSQAAVTAVKLNYQRAAPLIKQNHISKQDYDNLHASYLQAAATVEANQAQLNTAQINLRYTTITAPIEGQIGRSNVTVGALVTANQTDSMVTIRKLEPMYVDMAQAGDDYLALRRSLESGAVQPTSVTTSLIMPDGKYYEHKGTLQFTDIAIDESTGSIGLRASYPNPKNYLLPGMYVRTRVNLGQRENGILIPQQAVQRSAKGEASVLLVNDENKTVSQPVVISRSIGNQYLVDEGLTEGQRVIVGGLVGVKTDMSVTPVAVSTTAATSNSEG